jgi:hypothetical protein
MRLLHQCAAMKRAGVDGSVLTARWHSSWPEMSVCRDLDIFRLLPNPSSNWNESHFQKNVVNWISKRVHEFDCIYVDRADGLLCAILSKANKWNKSIITRFAFNDTGFAISNGQRMTALAMADACRRSTRIVCSTPSSHRFLVSQGISESQIVRIPETVWDESTGLSESPIGSSSKAAAANSLFETSSDFVIPAHSPVVLHLGLAQAKPMHSVVKSVCDLLDAGALLRMWIVGSGLQTGTTYDLIKSRGWHREILMFDGFDDIRELIQVADLAIACNSAETLQYCLPMFAMAAVPLILNDDPDCRSWLPETHYHQLYSSERMLEEKLNDWLADRDRWQSMATLLSQSLRRTNSGDACSRSWVSLFRDTCAERTA